MSRSVGVQPPVQSNSTSTPSSHPTAPPPGYGAPPPGKSKKPIYKRVWFLALAAIVLLIVIISVSTSRGGNDPTTAATPSTSAQGGSSPPSASAAEPSTSSAPPAPQFGQVGQPVSWEAGDTAGTLTVNGVRILTDGEGPLNVPSQTGNFLAIDVTIQCTAGTCSTNPLYFKLSDKDTGQTYNVALGTLNAQPATGDLAPGRQVRGEVPFDAPAGRTFLLDMTDPLFSTIATVEFSAQLSGASCTRRCLYAGPAPRRSAHHHRDTASHRHSAHRATGQQRPEPPPLMIFRARAC
jgi:hypothetical protein